MSDIQLSHEQLEIVNSSASAIVVSASAGSGKTEVIAHRIERILSSAADEDFRVLAVSYTAKAAEELRSRLRSRLGGLHKRVDSDTIHGFALSILRRFGTRIGLPPEPEILTRNEDRGELLQQWIAAQGRPPLDDVAGVLSELDMARTRGRDASLLSDWKAALADRGAVDYPELLERTRDLLEIPWVQKNLRQTYKHVVVDEAQNLTKSQYAVLRALIGSPSSATTHAMLVGDERQSIVGFAGADPALMNTFMLEYGAQRFDLHTNYRSAENIVIAAARVAEAMGPPRVPRDEDVWFPAKGLISSRSFRDEKLEGEFIAEWVAHLLDFGISRSAIAPGEQADIQPEEIAILGRTAASLRATQHALRARRIQFAVGIQEDEWLASVAGSAVLDLLSHLSAPDHRSVRRRLASICGVDAYEWSSLSELFLASESEEIRALARLASASDVSDFVAQLGSVEIVDADWAGDVKLLRDAWDLFVDDVERSGQTFGNFRQFIFRLQRGSDLDAGVRVLTVHKAQGREYRAVAIVGFSEGQFPDFRARNPEARLAELRALYVAMTRASRQLLITWPRTRETRYGPRATKPSSFMQFVRVDQ